jgi:CRP-like cAMP-binding protein
MQQAEERVAPIDVENPEDEDVPTAIPMGFADDFDFTKYKYIVPPRAPFRAYWDLAIVVALTYTATVTVFEVAFLEVSINAIFIINRFIDLLFVSDLVLSFMTPYVDPDSLLWVVDHRMIAWRYITVPPYWFFIDSVTCIPFDAIAYALQSNGNLHALRILRLLRLVRVAKILRGLSIVKRWEVETGLKNSTKTLMFFAMLMLLLSHWVSCFFALVVSLESRSPDDFVAATIADNGTTPNVVNWNWITAYFEGDLGYPSGSYGIWTIYLGGYYLSVMTLTTIGYGDLTPKTDEERGYIIVVMLLGGAVYAYAVGSVCSIVANMDPLKNEFKNDMDDLNDYMSACKLPKDLRDRLRKYMHFAYGKRRTEHQRDLLDKLSPSLVTEISDIVNRQWVEKVPYLNRSEVPDYDAFLASIASKIVLHAHAPMEVLLRPGLQVNEMFILDRGAVLIHDTYDSVGDEPTQEVGQLFIRKALPEAVINELSSGCCFGHESMLQTPFYSPYYATSLTFTNIYHLKDEDFQAALALFPETQASLKQYAEKHKFADFSVQRVYNVVDPHDNYDSTTSGALMVNNPVMDELNELKNELASVVSEIKIRDEALKMITRRAG